MVSPTFNHEPRATTRYLEVLDFLRRMFAQRLGIALDQVDNEHWPKVLEGFDADMRELTQYCFSHCLMPRQLTTAFIRGVHQQLCPPGKVFPYTRPDDGTAGQTLPGEYKAAINYAPDYRAPGQFVFFYPPEKVADAMESAVAEYNTQATSGGAAARDAVLKFMADLQTIHPFPDYNGRLSYLVANLLLVGHGLPQLRNFESFRALTKTADFIDARVAAHSRRDVELFHALPLYGESAPEKVPPPPARQGVALPRLSASCPGQTSLAASASCLEDQVLSALLAEVRLALDAGDLPVGAAFTVGETLVASHHNTIFSQGGQHFHAERNLLGSLEGAAIPVGRRILWVTLAPCVRCAKAIVRLGVDEVVYVLDDPFDNGKALLTKAGIAVTRRTEWEEETLRLMMEAFSHLPELCAWKQFPYFLAQWRRYACLAREEQLGMLFRHHLASYLYQKMPFLTTTEKAEQRRRFLAEVEALVALTLRECATPPSLAFVRDLHRALFPPQHRHHAVGDDGVATETGSGEWRCHVLWPRHVKFSDPEAIEHDLAGLLEQVAAKAVFRREDALQFFFDFTSIHPFTDGNCRLAAILADLLCLNHGLAPVALDHKNLQLKTVLLERAFADNAAPVELLALVDGWNQGRLVIKPRSPYDDHPSVWHTYAKRIGNKQYVVERILAKLAGRPLASPMVITDLGAGTGIIADGLLHALAQQEGLDFTYHYLEPSQTSVDHFRATSRYAALPQVVVHAMPVEEFLLPQSDLIIAVQSIQYSANREEALRNMLSALKPGGLALVVNNAPDSEELRMSMALGVANGQLHALFKVFLEQARCYYEEEVVETSVRFSPADRDTPEGDDLLAWYLRQPPASLSPARKDAFWQVVARYSKEGLLQKKESFFWIEAGGGDITFAETVTACLLPRICTGPSRKKSWHGSRRTFWPMPVS